METSRVLPRLILIDIGLVMALFDRHTIRLLRAQVPAQESQLIRSHNTLGLAIRHLKVTITLLADLQLNPLITYLLFGHSQITDPPLEKSVGPMANDQDELILVACWSSPPILAGGSDEKDYSGTLMLHPTKGHCDEYWLEIVLFLESLFFGAGASGELLYFHYKSME